LKVYFISGLGADERVFSRIHLPDGFEPVHLNWIPPLSNEDLEDYAKRFAQQIQTDGEFILIGLSFGGILASEIAKIIHPSKIIIISSLASYHELPWYFKWAGKFGLQKLITPGIYKQATLLNSFMGPGDKEMKAIVYDYVRKADPDFIRWSLNVILHWKHNEKLPNITHIHGSNDHLLPCKYVRPEFVVARGGHLMVFNKSTEVNDILKKILT
jgi:pimeloyl-ACP methyl ester carboxylesterase